MNFTQQQLESMSDLELNIVAANHFYDCDEITVAQSAGDSVEVICNGVVTDSGYSPCENWSDCGDLIDEYGVIADGTGLAMIVGYDERYSHIVKCEVKRAVTIVYILVKQGKSNDN